MVRDRSPVTREDAIAALLARPIAHRGLHDAARIENTLEAFEAAISAGFGIECDVRLSADGEAMVFHDDRLERLTLAEGPLDRQDARALRAIAFRRGDGRIPTLAEVLERIAGRTALCVELKSPETGDTRLAARVAELATAYLGPIALKSFDPAMILHLRALANRAIGDVPLGIVGMDAFDDQSFAMLSAEERAARASLAHAEVTRPDFLSWCHADLPSEACSRLRAEHGTPLLAWTIRSPDEALRVSAHADQMIFEGFIPGD
jgi:glycerophosphoryl diester phosphodiesterase